MKRRRHTPERAVRKVREGERMLGSGSDLAEVLRHLEITESTWHRWRRAQNTTDESDDSDDNGDDHQAPVVALDLPTAVSRHPAARRSVDEAAGRVQRAEAARVVTQRRADESRRALEHHMATHQRWHRRRQRDKIRQQLKDRAEADQRRLEAARAELLAAEAAHEEADRLRAAAKETLGVAQAQAARDLRDRSHEFSAQPQDLDQQGPDLLEL